MSRKVLSTREAHQSTVSEKIALCMVEASVMVGEKSWVGGVVEERSQAVELVAAGSGPSAVEQSSKGVDDDLSDSWYTDTPHRGAVTAEEGSQIEAAEDGPFQQRPRGLERRPTGVLPRFFGQFRCGGVTQT